MKSCIIIDDPILHKSYGFLNFYKLLDLMDKHNFHCTIAFIPWNYRRTSTKIAKTFLERPDRFSLCVHGCDHTRREFGSTNEVYLTNISRLALYRMNEHQRRTGIPYSPVMVFPQGIFSRKALEVLHKVGFGAAMNTEINPTDGGRPDSTPLPFFQRFKPEDINDPLDPCLVVLHHTFFRNDGYQRLVDFVKRMNDRGAEWMSLGDVVGVKGRVGTEEMHPIRIHGLLQMAKITARRLACDIRDNIVMPMGGLSAKIITIISSGYLHNT
jgi:hypothetical protein